MAGIDVRVAEARRRWRAAGDRLWPIAVSDGPAYQRAVEAVGALVDELRGRVDSLEGLVRLEADPGAPLAGAREVVARAAERPELLAAACAVLGDELAATQARQWRAHRIAEARAAGVDWVTLDESPARAVEMHVATGRAVVATVDPYWWPQPYRIGELVLDVTTGEPLTDQDGSDEGCSSRERWLAERARRRTEVEARLDRSEPCQFR